MAKFASSKTIFKTKPLFTTLSSLIFVFTPYLIIWILFGEGRQILFINNGSDLNFKTYWYDATIPTYSWEFYTVYFSFMLLPILVWLIGKYPFNILKIDCLPFLYISSGFWIGILFAGLIPIPGPEDLNSVSLPGIVFAKIIIGIIMGIIYFFISNYLVKIILLNSRSLDGFIADFQGEELANKKALDDQKTTLDKVERKKEETWEI
ncbi:MAG: hypothetical protein ACRCVI_02330 [Mycoplasmoidaceae bacterium]